MSSSQVALEEPRKTKSLAQLLVEKMTLQIRAGQLRVGQKLPTEAAIMKDFGVSRTVVREAISRLQASFLVETRHGIGTFVLPQDATPSFRISAHQLGTLREVIALLEFRISIETEAAALALAEEEKPERFKSLATLYRPPLLGKCKKLYERFNRKNNPDKPYKSFVYSFDGETAYCADAYTDKGQQQADEIVLRDCEEHHAGSGKYSPCRIYPAE